MNLVNLRFTGIRINLKGILQHKPEKAMRWWVDLHSLIA
jgi:hypothetical protein